LAAALLLAVAAYGFSLRVPFQFDDIVFVRDNPALRALWPPGRWIHAGSQETRPLANLTFALNYAWSGQAPWSYHLVNLGLHLACVVLLFVLVRRSLRLLAEPWPARADLVAAAAALLLAAHTAHSESVIYIQGRPGLLATAFGLAALALAADLLPRWATARRRGRGTAAVAACVALAVLGKESAAVLPALLLLLDVAVVARGRLREVGKRALAFHLPQWLTLGVLPLVFATLRNPHHGVFGFDTVDVARFYLTQPEVLLFYLRLYLWPAGLTIDRAFPLARASQPLAWLAVAAVAGLVVLTLWALRRAPWAGFCAAWWLAALAPTSLLPNREYVAERYMTFATPAFAALAAWGFAAAWGALAPARGRVAGSFALALAASLALPLAWQTHHHGQVWLSGRTLWKQALDLSPGRGRAWYQYGWFLWNDAEYDEALRAARRAWELDRTAYQPPLLISRTLADRGQADSAVAYANEAIRLAPRQPEAHGLLALALMQLQRWPEALAATESALRVDSSMVTAFYYRAQCRIELGDTARARLDARSLEARRPDAGYGPYLFGLLDLVADHDSSAARWFQLALQREPNHVEAMGSYSMALFKLGRKGQALEAYRRYFAATRADRWDYASLYYTALCYQSLGRDREAVETLQLVTRLRPNLVEPWIEMAYTLAATRDSTLRDPAAARRALGSARRLMTSFTPAMRARIAEVRAALGERS
jgi:tetratricopeptide (TPR) repeat protein